MRVSTILAGMTLAGILCGGCANPQGATLQEQRDYTLKMRDESLTQIYAKYPAAQTEVAQAPGYVVFDAYGYGFGLLGGGNGYGVVTEKGSKQNTYMRNFHFDPGLGFGGKSCRQLIIFGDDAALRHFVDAPWEVGGNAQAAFKFGETGGSAESSGFCNPGYKVYDMTQNGIVLRASIPIFKFSRDKELNNP